MIGFEEKDGILHCDGLPLPAIAQEFGTPAYVYSSAHIKAQYEALAGAMKTALPEDRQPKLCYACKANSNIAILAYLRNLGSNLEIVSEGELRRGLKAGFAGKQIVSTGVGKSDSEIKACLEADIHQFNVESLPELENIGRIAQKMQKRATVVFRFNPNVAGGGHDKISTGRKRDKFGIGVESIHQGFAMTQEMDYIDAVGLSMHIGSQVFTVEVFKEAFEKLPALVQSLRDAGYTISRLDIGGGFPIIYKDERLLDLNHYAQWVADIILPLRTEIILEPGRYLVGNAGSLLTQVTYVKETQDGHRFLILDAAMNDLIRPTLYDAYHGIEPVAHRDAPQRQYDVVGPVCESTDTFSKKRVLPTMERGDLAVIQSAGAYGFCMASNYNTRPLPPEILVMDGQAHLISPRQTYDALLEREKIPGTLTG